MGHYFLDVQYVKPNIFLAYTRPLSLSDWMNGKMDEWMDNLCNFLPMNLQSVKGRLKLEYWVSQKEAQIYIQVAWV